MFLDLLRDTSQVSTDRQSIAVTFTHWARRSSSFSFNLQRVRAIEAIQIEPATIQLTFVLEDGSRRAISEEMAGWNEVLMFVQNHFAGFDRDAYEHAKGDINRVCLCWSNASNARPEATK